MTDIQIKYWEHQENVRHNLATEQETNRSNVAKETETFRHNVVGEGETYRHNIVIESQNAKQINESIRHNLVTEKETERSNRAKEYETNRSNVAKEKEMNRHNKVTESLSAIDLSIRQQSLNESIRHNKREEQLKDKALKETKRSNIRNENIKIAQNAIDSKYKRDSIDVAEEQNRIRNKESNIKIAGTVNDYLKTGNSYMDTATDFITDLIDSVIPF